MLALALAACATNGSSAAPTTEHPPPYVGQVGVPIHAKASNGATADITFNGITWFPQGAGCSNNECPVVELTIAGTSTRPFKYSESFVTVGYGDGPQPWTHPDDDHRWGGLMDFNYQKVDKLPPLRVGSVTAGQTVHGFVGYWLGGRHDLYVRVDDPDDVSDIEAGWQAPG